MRKRATPPGDMLDAERLLDQELQKYAGKWVAVVRHKVVAAGDSLRVVVDEAKAKGYNEPLVMRAPEHGAWVV